MSAIKIFNMDDCMWYAAASLEEAIAAYTEDTGCGEEDGIEPNEISEEAMDRLTFQDCDENERPIAIRTFREQLAKEIADGTKFPCLFACTEY